MNFDRTMRTIQQAVVDAGGEWIGVQDAFPGDLLALPEIVFRRPVTKKIILLSFNPVLVNIQIYLMLSVPLSVKR